MVFTNHKPLVFAFHKTTDPWSPRQQRHLASISEYTTDVQHISGKENFVADALSRSTINAVHSELAIDFAAMAAAQLDDADIATYKTCTTGLNLQPVPFGAAEVTLLCDVSTGRPRPLVPATFRRAVFDVVHNLSHPSIQSTKTLIAAKFVWPGLQRQVGLWARTCVACQRAKIQRHTRAPLQTFSVPHRHFDHINIDLVGPLPILHSHTMLFTIVDRFTRWPEAIPMSGDTSAAACARILLSQWISRFGLPADISSDRGSQFTSQLWTELARLLGTALHHTTAYHPQANGLVERFHRQLKSSLRARLRSPQWSDELPWIMLGIRTTPKEDLGASSAELVYGYPLTVPSDFLATSSLAKTPAMLLPTLQDTV